MKAKWGAIVVDGRGKIGGHVASKNRSGSYFRTKVSPVNPQSSFQSAVRAIFTTLSQAWRSLSTAQIAAWNAAVDNFKGTNVFGDIKTPSGMNVFMRLNQNIVNVGGSQINVPPTDLSSPDGTEFTATSDVSDTEVELTWASGAVPASTVRVVEATPPVSPGVSFVKNQFRVIANIAAAAVSPQDVWADYVAKFGAPVAGQKIIVRMKDVSLTTGLTSPYYYASLIVTA